MPDFAGLFALLLVPVALLLLVARRLAPRLRYPHDLLEPEGKRRLAAFLFRSIRARHDLLFDIALAAAVAAALLDAKPDILHGGGARGRGAVVIDGSRSMLAGPTGRRPIDAALGLLSSRPGLSAAAPWILAFDPDTRRTRLLPLESLARGRSGPTLADALAAELPPFSVDYRVLAELAGRGYRSLTLITDSRTFAPRGFEVIETGFAGDGVEGRAIAPDPAASQVYPASARYDRVKESWTVRFAEGGRKALLAIRRPLAAGQGWTVLGPAEYRVTEAPGGRVVELKEPGLRLFSFADPEGGIPADFLVDLAPARIPADARGDFSSLVLRALPHLDQGPRPSIVFADLGEKDLPPAKLRLIVTSTAARTPWVADPGLTGGRPLAIGLEAGADFAWGEASLGNPDLPLAYLGAVEEALPRPFETAVPAGATGLSRIGFAYLAATPEGPRALNPGPGEFFRPEPEGFLELKRPDHRLLWALLIAALAVGKLVTARLVSGRGEGPGLSGRGGVGAPGAPVR